MESVVYDFLPNDADKTDPVIEYRYTKQEAKDITERFNRIKALLEASGADLSRVHIVEGKQK